MALGQYKVLVCICQIPNKYYNIWSILTCWFHSVRSPVYAMISSPWKYYDVGFIPSADQHQSHNQQIPALCWYSVLVYVQSDAQQIWLMGQYSVFGMYFQMSSEQYDIGLIFNVGLIWRDARRYDIDSILSQDQHQPDAKQMLWWLVCISQMLSINHNIGLISYSWSASVEWWETWYWLHI